MPTASSADQLRQFVIESGGNTGLLIVSLYQTMRVDQAEQHHRELAADRAWQKRRSKDRIDAIRAIVADLDANIKVTDRPAEIRRLLNVYATRGAWRFERGLVDVDDPARARLHRALSLYSGKVPSRVTIWRALIGAH
jgi:hypothetical protein